MSLYCVFVFHYLIKCSSVKSCVNISSVIDIFHIPEMFTFQCVRLMQKALKVKPDFCKYGHFSVSSFRFKKIGQVAILLFGNQKHDGQTTEHVDREMNISLHRYSPIEASL